MSEYHKCFLAYMVGLALGLFIVMLLEQFNRWRKGE